MKFEKKALLALIAVVLFHFLFNFYVLNESRIIRKYDEADRIIESAIFHKILISHGNVFGDFLNLRGADHPKLFALIQGIMLTLLNSAGLADVNWMILATSSFFLFILLMSVYKTGSILCGRPAGLLAAVLLSFSPIIFGHSRLSMIDFPLTAMVCLSLLSLLKTRNFDSFLFSLLAGLSFGLALFTKETAVLFILAPFLYYSFISLREAGPKKRRRITNFGVIILVFSGFIWALFNSYGGQLLNMYWSKSFLLNNNSDALYYVRSLPLLYLGLLPAIALIPLILSFIFNIKKKSLFLILWFFVPLFIFSISSNKSLRFLMPALPALFLLLSSEALRPAFSRAVRRYAFILVLSAVFQYGMFIFFSNFTLKQSFVPEALSVGPLKAYSLQEGLFSVYRDKDYNLAQQLIDFFSREDLHSSRLNKIIFTFDTGMHCLLCYEMEMKNMPFNVDVPQQCDIVRAPYPERIDWEKFLLSADYVIHKTGGLGNRGYREDIGGKFQRALKANYMNFERMADLKAQDGEYIYIYRKKG